MTFYTNIMINYLIFISLVLILGILIYLLLSIRQKDIADSGGNKNLETKLSEVSNDINKIELDLAKSNSILFISFETSLNLVSKFLLPPESAMSFCLMLNRR